MAGNTSTCLRLVLFFNFLISLICADRLGDLDLHIQLIRERLHTLETRFVKDLGLLRRELYLGLDTITSNNNVKTGSTMTPNINGHGIKSEMKNLIQDLQNKMNMFRNGLTEEKRIRRSIQFDIQSLRENDAATAEMLLSGWQNLSNILNVLPFLESLQSDVKAIAKSVQTHPNSKESRVSDCSEWLRLGHTVSGIYTVFPESMWRPLDVYCDMETDGGGWTVFQRRVDGSEDFFRNWMNYTFGFGDLSGEFWLGNEFLHRLTSSGPHELRIELEDFENNTREAKYGLFSVGPRSGGFVLSIDFFSGNVSDSLIQHHTNQKFSTYDVGPLKDCSLTFKGGWWYQKCHTVNLNGLYLNGKHESYADGINWKSWKGYHYSLKRTEMKLRPR